MEPLARLPLFFSLAGKQAVVAGDSPAVLWKAELLSAAGASVHLFGQAFVRNVSARAATSAAGPILFHAEGWSERDFDGAALAVGAFEDNAEAMRFTAASRAASVPVNVVDKPDLCDFYFGAIVNRSPLVVGISTDGAAPAFAQLIRGQIEALIPHGFAGWAEAARRWRSHVRARLPSSPDRRRFWQIFSERAMRRADSTPECCDLNELLDEAVHACDTPSGSILLVDAGSGDPSLLTLGALRALQSADVILFDDTVSAKVLDLARREAMKLKVRDTKPERDEIHEFMMRLANSGRRIVRLTSGYSTKLEDIREVINACRNTGVHVEVIPGINQSQAAARSFDRLAN
jgi:uroporphyrin-III C-methyltransferase / precorrin-2 dehydrogenase / sirohydrochlorin ferrochelatase